MRLSKEDAKRLREIAKRRAQGLPGDHGCIGLEPCNQLGCDYTYLLNLADRLEQQA